MKAKKRVSTCTHNLLDIHRLEVGTESSVDHCKSIKTQLMQLFEGSGNSDVLVRIPLLLPPLCSTHAGIE